MNMSFSYEEYADMHFVYGVCKGIGYDILDDESLTDVCSLVYITVTLATDHMLTVCTRSVRKVSDRIFLCEHLMDYNLARLHKPTLNLSAHA